MPPGRIALIGVIGMVTGLALAACTTATTGPAGPVPLDGPTRLAPDLLWLDDLSALLGPQHTNEYQKSSKHEGLEKQAGTTAQSHTQHFGLCERDH